MVSEIQLAANRENAKKGGVKTEEGKALVKYNALKHGLLAREAVITVGEGAENPEEFDALLEDLTAQLDPVGSLEEMLVEKLAVSHWRLRRAYRYETGLIRRELDNATDDFYKRCRFGERVNKTDEEIEEEVEEAKKRIKYWETDKRELAKMCREGKSLEEIYDWEANWEWMGEKVGDVVEDKDAESLEPGELKELLNKAGWSDHRIWQAHMEVCDERIEHHRSQIAALKKEKEKNRLKLQVTKRLGSIPSKEELERLLRYEGTIERQFYKALNQLERLQRLRMGDNVPAPVQVELDVNTDCVG